MDLFAGATLLVGLTYVGAEGAVQRRRQLLGVVAPAAGVPGVRVREPDGEHLALPADAAAYYPAPRGDFLCLATGQTFTDPDFITSWRITLDAAGHETWQPNYAPLVVPPDPNEWDFTYRHDPAHLRRSLERYSPHYLGQTVRVALQVYQEAADGGPPAFLGEEQHAGRLARASLGEGAVLLLENGKEFRLPPDLALLQLHPPHLLTRWTVYRNPEDAE